MVAERAIMAEPIEDASAEDQPAELNLHSAGDMLRHAREQQSLEIADIAKETRIPQRHLQSLESGDFGALPGRTYAIGFAKSYARAVGLSETKISGLVREEMDEQGHGAYSPEMSGYAPSAPSSIPSRTVAWSAAGAAILVLVGYLIWRTLFLGPSDIPALVNDAPEAVATASEAAAPAAVTPATATAGPVVLTATENVWLKIYDAKGNRLLEKEMGVGETFQVPDDADNPMILTGRPNALTVTVGGKQVATLGPPDRTVADLPISAAALLARGPEQGAAADSIAAQN
ncbi:MAG: helix-turn-helix domain-containing protein [Parasphingorhabdus sp.]|nr:helix-turn-helix domain-containing protein [Parasphingorhabdus sp.]